MCEIYFILVLKDGTNNKNPGCKMYAFCMYTLYMQSSKLGARNKTGITSTID